MNNGKTRTPSGNSRLPQWGLMWLNQVQCFYQHCAWLTVKCSEIPHCGKRQNVTNKPKKKDSDMKIDKTTYKDKENQIGLTDDRTSRPEKVLFFADTHFLFFKSRPTFGTLPFARHTSQRFAKVKEPILADMYKKL